MIADRSRETIAQTDYHRLVIQLKAANRKQENHPSLQQMNYEQIQ